MTERKITLSFKDRLLIEHALRGSIRSMEDAGMTWADETDFYEADGYDPEAHGGIGEYKGTRYLTCIEFVERANNLLERIFNKEE